MVALLFRKLFCNFFDDNDLYADCFLLSTYRYPGPEAMYEYDLFAVINHEGQINNGHYTNYARFNDEVKLMQPVFQRVILVDIIFEQWYRFDDDK